MDILEIKSDGPLLDRRSSKGEQNSQRLTCSFRANRVNPRTQAEIDIPHLGVVK